MASIVWEHFENLLESKSEKYWRQTVTLLVPGCEDEMA